tara:strand:- start:1177 stop:2061 length:885 start_codon:yes stop_codon:yes gene_type:complete
MPQVLGVLDGTTSGTVTAEKKDKLWITHKVFTNVYYVLADTTAQNEDDLGGTVGLPALWSQLQSCTCVKITASELQRVIHPTTGAATILWKVACDYDSEVDPDDEETPLNLVPTIRWHGENQDEVLESDAVSGDAVVTACNESVLVTAPFVTPVLTIKRYETHPFDPSTILAYSNRTNSATFWGAPIGSALFLPPEVDEETIEQVKYAVVTYAIKFKIRPGISTPWKGRVLHQGYKYRKNAGDPVELYTDKNGNPTLVNLKSDGTKLPDTDPAEYISFDRFQSANFNSLTLGPY